MEEAGGALEDLRAPPDRRRAKEEAGHTEKEGEGKARTQTQQIPKGGYDMEQALFKKVPTRNPYFFFQKK